MNNVKILIYDDENIAYKTGYCTSFGVSSDAMEVTSILDDSKVHIQPMTADLHCEISNYEELDNITLDETTMKRIAKYNKEVEIKRLDEKIKEKKEKIKELDDILTDKNKRVDMLKNYIANIFDIDVKCDDEDMWDY